MEDKETYYIVDYENVHEDGLSGAETLTKLDHVHLFTTKNAPYISIQTLIKLNSADLQCHEVPAGKQSLDMHLASYLGYLIGKYEKQPFHCIIVSRDKDYDKIIASWNKGKRISISRQDQIRHEQKPDENLPVVETVVKALEQNGVDDDKVKHVAAMVSEHYEDKSCKQILYRSLVSKYGQQEGLAVYTLIKKLLG